MRINPKDLLLYAAVKTLSGFDKRDRDASAFDPSKVKSILAIASTAIGDTLLATPAFRALRKRYPEAKIVAFMNRANMELFKGDRNIDEVVPYYGGYRRFLRTVMRLRKYRFDLALIFHGNDPQTVPLCYLSGAPFIFRLPNNKGYYNFLLSNRSPVMKVDELGHAIEVRLKTAAFAGCPSCGTDLELVIDRGDEAAADELLRKWGVADKRPLIGLQPGAATIYKMWPSERFIELGRRLLASYPGAAIIVTGSPSERRLCEEVASKIGSGALSIAGKAELKLLPPIIRRLSLLVTNDTGPMHIAVAVKTPVVALFGPTSSKGIGPLQDLDRHVVIQKEIDCFPCVTKKCSAPVCMQKITVGEVFASSRSVIDKEEKRPRK